MALLDPLEGGLAVADDFGAIAEHLEVERQPLGDRRVVLDDRDERVRRGRAHGGAVRWRGSTMRKVAPLPSDSTSTLPWWASTTARTSARPSPEPELPPAVAAEPRSNFWKIASRSGRAMPG